MDFDDDPALLGYDASGLPIYDGEGDTDDDSDESGLGDDVCGIHDEHSQDSLSSSVFGSPEVVHSPPVYPQARNEFSVGNRYFS